ncbi:hypothetical protein [Hyphococcus sp. DH-69]|uniref:hypothetical protein n=1 Tax=Hyphococcus formosus TaxID=3143534 RepID=UPI00398B4D73
MRKLVMFLGVLVAFSGSTAFAHPGSKILTTAGGVSKQAMTSGVRYEDVNGVHVFRGSTALLGDEAAPRPSGKQMVVKKIEIRHTWRSFRHLRTQGFYSGDAYPTRRYTQGFYSSGR